MRLADLKTMLTWLVLRKCSVTGPIIVNNPEPGIK